MSGGSYDYLYGKSVEVDYPEDTLKTMIKDLKRHGTDVGLNIDKFQVLVEDLNKLKKQYKNMQKRIIKCNDMLDHLIDIFRSKEWYESCDYSRDDVTSEINQYTKFEG